MSALLDSIVLKLQADASVTAAATGGIYPGLPPEGATSFPFITVTAQSAPRPERTFQNIAFEDATYLVKAIDRNTSPKPVGDLNMLIRASLDGTAVTVTGYDLITVIWLQDISMVEEYNGQIYQHEGGLYQIWASET